MKSDAEIKRLVEQELQWDTHVKEAEVGVEVEGAVVTLSGTLGSWGERLAAEKAAHRVAEVLDVANDILVKVPGSSERSDADIAKAVRHALEWDVFVPDARIRSTVSAGHVTLEGDVDYMSQRNAAEKAIRNLTGISGVTNLLEVRVPLAAADVRRAIEEALQRRVLREASRISLKVHDGTVTVSGAVNNWAEKEAVLGAARGTRGVRIVDDKLRVEWHA